MRAASHLLQVLVAVYATGSTGLQGDLCSVPMLLLSSFSRPALHMLPESLSTPHMLRPLPWPTQPPVSLLQLLTPPFLPHGLPGPLEPWRPPCGRLAVRGLMDSGQTAELPPSCDGGVIWRSWLPVPLVDELTCSCAPCS